MSLPTSEPIPFPEDELPPARKRRQRRLVLPEAEDERARYLDAIGLRLTPGLEFFLSALLSGAVFGLALVVDSPALAVLAALLAPFMGPALGPGLAAVAGSVKYLFKSLGWLLTAGLIYLLSGTLAGIAARILPAASAAQAAAHLNPDWGSLLLLTVGVAFTTFLVVRSPQQKQLVSSVAIAYTLFLPLGAAGFGLTAGIGPVWLGGLGVFALHLAWAALCGVVTFAFLKLRPRGRPGYILTGVYLAACLLAALPSFLLPPSPPVSQAQSPQSGLSPQSGQDPQSGQSPQNSNPPQSAAPLGEGSSVLPPSATAAAGDPLPAATETPAPPPSSTPGVPITSTPTRTLVPTNTPTITVTPLATPVWARINAKGGDGAFVRAEPRYDALIVSSLLNGTLVEVLPDVLIEEGVTWIKVRTADDKEGWIVRSLLATATPAPAW